MSFPLIIRPEAEQDIAAARDWNDGQRDGLGNEFLRRVQEVFERIQDMPELYGAFYRGLRRCKLRRFRYVVYYRFAQDRVEVVAVVHGSRHPRVWQSRA